MNSELKVLKIIWENKGMASTKSISNQAGFGIDYANYICKFLIKHGRIHPIKNKRSWYKITAAGIKELKLMGIVYPKISKKFKDVEKIIWQASKRRRRNYLIEAEEKKLNLGRAFAKAVSLLKRSKRGKEE